MTQQPLTHEPPEKWIVVGSILVTVVAFMLILGQLSMP